MECKIDCSKCPEKSGACCGIFQMENSIVDENKDKFQVIPTRIIESINWKVVLTEDLFCVFLNRKTRLCAIYENRPEVCRLYGMSKELPCAYFKRSGARRSPASEKVIKREINKFIDRVLKDVKNAQNKVYL